MVTPLFKRNQKLTTVKPNLNDSVDQQSLRIAAVGAVTHQILVVDELL
jgi:DNA-binding TFAR19-related protein (PDSD5 family)